MSAPTMPLLDAADEQRSLLEPQAERVGPTAAAQESFRRFNAKMYGALCARAAVPTLYTTVRVFYLMDLPSDTGVNIAAQLAWVNLILEVFNETLILPLYHCLGVTIGDRRETIERVRTGMGVTLAVYLCLGAVIFGATPVLVRWMAQNPATVGQTTVYIRLEMLSVLLKALGDFLVVVFVLLDKYKRITVILCIQLVTTILCDTIFLSSMPISLQLGVNGIAFSNWVSSGAILAYAMYALSSELGMSASDWISTPRSRGEAMPWLKLWADVGKFSGLDSFVRNLTYMLAIVRMMNVINQAGICMYLI